VLRDQLLQFARGIALCIALFLSASTLAATCDGADEVVLGWLDKMSRSLHQNNYHGVATLQRKDDMQVVQISHLVKQGVSNERLTRLTGQGAQVERLAHPLECIHPGHELLRIGSGIKAGDCGLANSYRFKMGAMERVAGRPAILIEVRPRDMYRYGYTLALDKQTGLLLKAETHDHSGMTLERFQYANLYYETSAPEPVQTETTHKADHPHPGYASKDPELSRPWQVNWLPGGFMATDTAGAAGMRRSYTDGLAVFSVFLEEFQSEIKPGEGVVRNGGTVSYTRGLGLEGRPVLVMVIGEIPVNTARMVADSVRWSK
jgi:sigma-E factor negative regulatory protein RseB